MGLLDKLLKFAESGEKEKLPSEMLFEEEAKIYGLTEEEKEYCKESNITPEEFMEEEENNK